MKRFSVNFVYVCVDLCRIALFLFDSSLLKLTVKLPVVFILKPNDNQMSLFSVYTLSKLISALGGKTALIIEKKPNWT